MTPQQQYDAIIEWLDQEHAPTGCDWSLLPVWALLRQQAVEALRGVNSGQGQRRVKGAADLADLYAATVGGGEQDVCRYCGVTYATCVDGGPCCNACLHANGHAATVGGGS